MNFSGRVERFLRVKYSYKELNDYIFEACNDYLKLKSEEKQKFVEDLFQQFTRLQDELFDQLPRSFLELALVISDRMIYFQFKKKQQGDTSSQFSKANELAIKLFNKVSNSKNKFLLYYYLNERMQNQQSIDAKFMILELYLENLKQLENKQDMFDTILPQVLKPLRDGLDNIVQFYLTKKLKDEDFKNPEGYYANFTSWIFDYMKRFLDTLVEILKEIDVQEIICLTHIYQQDEDGRIQKKQGVEKLMIKYFIQLFFLDVFECVDNLNELSQKNVPQIAENLGFIQNLIKEHVIPNHNQQNLIQDFIQNENFIQSALLEDDMRIEDEEEMQGDQDYLKFQKEKKAEQRKQQQKELKYTEKNNYNIIFVSLSVIDLLGNKNKDKHQQQKSQNIQLLYSSSERLRILFQVLLQLNYQRPEKLVILYDLLELLVEEFQKFSNKIEQKKLAQIDSQYYFQVDIKITIKQLLLNFGQKEKFAKFIFNLIVAHNQQQQVQILNEIIELVQGQEFIKNVFFPNIIKQAENLKNKEEQQQLFSQYQNKFSQQIQNELDLFEDNKIDLQYDSTYILGIINLITQFNEQITKKLDLDQQVLNKKLQKLKQLFMEKEEQSRKDIQTLIKIKNESPDKESSSQILGKYQQALNNIVEIKNQLEALN
ncbi:hypothetical protein PPERSA_07667 [Pseudocohnilembus persalinus]|uniref:Uncharacterized protein n=1 Tax=Pseudocohnilembus persalinus TaxID=266149 RepID=A0A0V0QIP0_PSEPJ|nr:hypothetical protein PPERSA_07667 [Pseudocohnilembus persalinus]|eukprot:KRX02022.1 hypothetical protein PPERSA_07667 [Pseudocohnilembus persalinus]